MKKTALFLLANLVFYIASAGSVFYVKTSGNDSNDGTSWNTALSSVQNAIDKAAASAKEGEESEVWIASGNYSVKDLKLANNVEIYGGFAGTEKTKSSRKSSNETIFIPAYSNGRILYCVFTENSPLTASAKVDSITFQNSGTQIYLEYASPVFSNCVFTTDDTITTQFNLSKNSNATFANCLFDFSRKPHFTIGSSTVNILTSNINNINFTSGSDDETLIIKESSITNSYITASSAIDRCDIQYCSINLGINTPFQITNSTILNSPTTQFISTYHDTNLYIENCKITNPIISNKGSMLIKNCDFDYKNSPEKPYYNTSTIWNISTISIENCSFDGKIGGTYLIDADRGTKTIIKNCTFTNNKIELYPLIRSTGTNDADLSVINCTFTNNLNCDGSPNTSDNKHSHSTSSCMPIIDISSKEAQVINCIFYDNTLYNCALHLNTPSNSLGYTIQNNIIENGVNNIYIKYKPYGSVSVSAISISNIIDKDPLLMPLADNGGKVKTMAVQKTSPAIGGGIINVGIPLYDARYFARTDANTIGAFQYGGFLNVEEGTLSVRQPPSDQNVYENTSVSFSVGAVNKDDDWSTGLKYLWFVDKNDGNGFVCTGEKASTIELTAKIHMNGWKYKCLVSNDLEYEFSDTATLFVSEHPISVEIIADPFDAVVDENTAASFAVSAKSTDEYAKNLQYVWFVDRNDGNGFVKAGCQTSTYSFTAKLEMDGYKFRCEISNGVDTVISKEATLTVEEVPVLLTIAREPSNLTVNEGATAVFSVLASSSDGKTPSYKWYVDRGNGFVSANSSSPELSFVASYSMNGYKFRCEISNGLETKTTKSATLTVKEAPATLTITKNPSSITVIENETASFTAAGRSSNNKPVSYKWQVDKGDGKGFTYAKCTDAAYSFTASLDMDGWQFRCEISNGSETQTTSIATLKVSKLALKDIQITREPQSLELYEKQKSEISIEAKDRNGKPLKYAWYLNKNDGKGWKKAGTSQTVKITASAKMNYYRYRCEVSNGIKTEISNEAVLTVRENIKITQKPKAQKVYENGNIRFEVAATGYKPSYQWQFYSEKSKQWIDIDWATSSICEPASYPEYNGYKFRCVVSNGGGSVITSPVTLTVYEAPKILDDILIFQNGEEAMYNEYGNPYLYEEYDATLSIVAKGYKIKYQWEVLDPDGGSWKNVKGGTKSSLTLKNLTEDNWDQAYRCKVYNDGGVEYSNAVSLIVLKPFAPKSLNGRVITFQNGDYLDFMAFTSASSGLLVGWEGAKLTGAKYKRTSIYDATLKITIQYPLDNGKFGKHILDGEIDFIDGIFYCEDAYGKLYEFDVSTVNYIYPPVPKSPIGRTFVMDYKRNGEPLLSVYVYSASKAYYTIDGKTYEGKFTYKKISDYVATFSGTYKIGSTTKKMTNGVIAVDTIDTVEKISDAYYNMTIDGYNYSGCMFIE